MGQSEKINLTRGRKKKNTPVVAGAFQPEANQFNNSDYRTEQFDYSSTTEKKRAKKVLDKGYGILPNVILFDKEMKPSSKLLYVYISSLCAVEGYCWAGNKHLAERMGVTVRQISNMLKDLEPYLEIKDGQNQQRTIHLKSVGRKVPSRLEKKFQHNITSGIKEKTKKKTADAVAMASSAAPNGRPDRQPFFGKYKKRNRKDYDFKKYGVDDSGMQPRAATPLSGYKTPEELGMPALNDDFYDEYYRKREIKRKKLDS